MGRFFGKKEEPKEDKPEPEESGGGVFSWFRRKDDSENTTETPVKKGAKKPTKGTPSSPSQAVSQSRPVRSGQKDLEKQQRREAKQHQKEEKEKREKAAKYAERKDQVKKRRDQQEKEEPTDDGSWLGRIPFFGSSSNTTATEDSSANSTNPLSAFQKIFERREEEWVDVFPKTRIMPGEMVPVTVKGLDLLVVASKDARSLYCIVNSCPHLGTPLETGQLVRLPVEEPKTLPPTSTSIQPKSALKSLTESDVTSMLQQDGCEDCIVCPLHRTAFALESGEVRGEWCPYPPVLGKLMGTVKQPTGAAVFDVRTKGKMVQVRINTPLKET